MVKHCEENHANLEDILSNIKHDQGGGSRHKCAGCAYNEGYKLGKEGTTEYDLKKIIDKLPFSQKLPERHRDPKEAFAEGYRHGLRDRK